MTFVKSGLINPDKVKELSYTLSKQHNCEINIGRTRPESHINPSNRDPGWRVNPPTTNIYTRKYGATTLYGVDFLKQMSDVLPEKIQSVQALRVLLNRMGESIKYISADSTISKLL